MAFSYANILTRVNEVLSTLYKGSFPNLIDIAIVQKS